LETINQQKENKLKAFDAVDQCVQLEARAL